MKPSQDHPLKTWAMQNCPSYTDEYIADQCGCAHSTICNILNYRNMPREKTSEGIAKFTKGEVTQKVMLDAYFKHHNKA